MRRGRSHRRRKTIAAAAALLLVQAAGARSQEMSFDEKLARVHEALKTNPARVNEHSLESCNRQRTFALRLYQQNHRARAERSLDYCFHVLRIPEERPREERPTGPALPDVQREAAREVEQALALEPDLEHGLEIYRGCAECHSPEGWGLRNGLVPQIAGQHRKVVIKQLADIRAGNRETVLMAPYAAVQVVGGVQAVADVAGYIDTLEITTTNGKGPGDALELGERLYRDNCARCHGAQGEGDADDYVPRIQAQHYNYLVRQFEWIRDGKRRNANAEMREQIAQFDDREVSAVLDYVSRLEPPAEFVAPEGWRNPDFATY